jgi:DNA-binding transcriptional regulator LsrR (DeoR family)
VTASDALREAYGLHNVLVVDVGDEVPDVARERIGRVAAGLLADILEEDDVLGLSWGRTLSGMVTSLTHLPRCNVVQLGGAVGGVDLDENSVEAVRRVAAVSGGKPYPICAPADRARPHDRRKAPRAPGRHRSHAPVRPGHQGRRRRGLWDPPSSRLPDSMTPDEREQVRRWGVVAEVSGVFLDGNGHVTARELRDRCVAITEPQLRAVPEIIVVADGAEKRDAIHAVLRGGYATALVTDKAVADHLLEHRPEARPEGRPSDS